MDGDRVDWLTRTIFVDRDEWPDYMKNVGEEHCYVENAVVRQISLPFIRRKIVWVRERLVVSPEAFMTLEKPMYSTSSNHIEIRSKRGGLEWQILRKIRL